MYFDEHDINLCVSTWSIKWSDNDFMRGTNEMKYEKYNNNRQKITKTL